MALYIDVATRIIASVALTMALGALKDPCTIRS